MKPRNTGLGPFYEGKNLQFNRDYAATLVSAVKKWFFVPLSLEKSPPKFLFLNLNPLINPMIAQVSLKKYFSPNFWAYKSLGDQTLSGW